MSTNGPTNPDDFYKALCVLHVKSKKGDAKSSEQYKALLGKCTSEQKSGFKAYHSDVFVPYLRKRKELDTKLKESQQKAEQALENAENIGQERTLAREEALKEYGDHLNTIKC